MKKSSCMFNHMFLGIVDTVSGNSDIIYKQCNYCFSIGANYLIPLNYYTKLY